MSESTLTTSPSAPLVSCIMPTHDRRAFVPRAIAWFLRQSYPRKELVIVDDGLDLIADLVPEDARVRLVRLARRLTLGAKRNIACEHARGSIIAHWDDDDWHAAHRLQYQIDHLLRSSAAICGIKDLLYLDLRDGRAWQYSYPAAQRPWLSGNSLMYTRAFWLKHHFPSIDVGEDCQFVWSASPDHLLILPDRTFHVGIIHEKNISPKQLCGAWWKPHGIDEIHRILADDWNTFFPIVHAGEGANHPDHEGDEGMYTHGAVAKSGDLELPEFTAFNEGQQLPHMRRWELPFVLHAGALENTSAVLDCTINPAGFQVRLAQLYPHVLYRHWNPTAAGAFCLPEGYPDGAFDRVFCINTLEHLLEPQRQSLIADFSRKLKPGGLLVITGDFYFESSWSKPEFLELGVIRADGKEIFNGWNRVTPSDWIRLCRPHDLHPSGGAAAPPVDVEEGDCSLYLILPPYPHACVGRVFHKGPVRSARGLGRRIVLALLCWNTRDISLESLAAYVHEARMLQRLGHEPSICVCDNGSHDGTAAAILEFEKTAGVPFKSITNGSNLGNSIARNQMIDHALEIGADYLLFMDGDIEIVPFSSVAMLRHLENNGRRLGCIGADSNGQTFHKERASKAFFAVEQSRTETTNLVAWTQYGMFRTSVFSDGARFDISPPFDGVGWGFEDNDLAFQMHQLGYLNQRFFGMTYLHRAARSSVRIMRDHGVDPQSLYARRKKYVVDKWTGVPQINDGPLTYVRRVEMRL